MASEIITIDQDFDGNKLLNMGEISIAGSTVLTPPAFAANQNDYNPTGLQIASILRLTSTGANQITGITAPDTARWKLLWITNIGASNITLVNASASSLATNRFATNGNTIVAPGASVILYYDQTAQRWRVDR